MIMEIQVLAWDRNKNVAGLQLLMGSHGQDNSMVNECSQLTDCQLGRQNMLVTQTVQQSSRVSECSSLTDYQLGRQNLLVTIGQYNSRVNECSQLTEKQNLLVKTITLRTVINTISHFSLLYPMMREFPHHLLLIYIY